MNVNEITFGVEFETTMPSTFTVGGYHSGRQATGLPTGWTSTSDASIDSTSGRVGCEFVSPVLRGAEGIASVIAALKAINDQGGQVNRSTGMHVHVGFDASNGKALDRLTTLVANFELAIYASTGTSNRQTGRWSRSVAVAGNLEQSNLRNHDRYRLLNVTNLLNGRRPTVEFRAFAGTLNAEKVVGHIRMSIALVERAITAKRITNWIAKPVSATSPIKRKGDGQTTLTRLFYQLGWIKGRTAQVFGAVGLEIENMKTSKRALMRMARKFDAAA